MRLRVAPVADHHRAAIARDREEQLREVIRQPDAAVAGGIAGRLPECMAMPLHVRRCMFGIGAFSYFLERCVLLLLQIVKTPRRRGVALRAGAHRRATDEDAVAINMHRLLRHAHEHHDWSYRRDLRMPPIFAPFERAGRRAGGRAFGMRRRLLHRLHGGEQSDGDSEDFQ